MLLQTIVIFVYKFGALKCTLQTTDCKLCGKKNEKIGGTCKYLTSSSPTHIMPMSVRHNMGAILYT